MEKSIKKQQCDANQKKKKDVNFKERMYQEWRNMEEKDMPKGAHERGDDVVQLSLKEKM